MRVGPYSPPMQQMQGRQYARQQYQQTNSHENGTEYSPALALTQRILSEQGERQAGYFLFAIKPYLVPAEIALIERQLQLRAECDPNLMPPPPRPSYESNNPPEQKRGGGMDLQMLQMLMGMMGGMNSGNSAAQSAGAGTPSASERKLDPMMLLKLLGK